MRIVWLIREACFSTLHAAGRLELMSPALVEAIGGLAAVLTTLCLVPQAVKIARERETRAISLPATLLSVLGVLLWLIYGVAVGTRR
jgi:MtN3 and saliva related transmembrane protein